MQAKSGNVFLYTDLSGIEARTLRWLAKSPSLNDFAEKDRGGPDPYNVAAARAFNKPLSQIDNELRQCGKVLCLQAQYQSGGAKVKNTISQWSGGKVNVTLEFANKAVKAFRDSEPEIVKFWDHLNKGFRSVLIGQRESVSINGYLKFYRQTKDTVAMRLPGGRCIYYNKCRILTHDVEISETKTLRKGSVAYYKHDANFEIEKGLTGYYGGLGSENSASGMARDIFCLNMLDCEANGLPIVHHTHDSVMCEVRECDAKAKAVLLEKIFCKPPAWAPTIPLKSPVKIVRRMPA